MSELYDKIVEIFEIPELNIDKANRRTLLRYATRTKFQQRREAFYSKCEGGRKSKVAICKTEDRPTWVHNLETLKTKQLREQLKGFLEKLGAFVNPKKFNLKKLAKDRNWHEVVYLDDDTKPGAGGSGAEDSDEDMGQEYPRLGKKRKKNKDTPAGLKRKKRAAGKRKRSLSATGRSQRRRVGENLGDFGEMDYEDARTGFTQSRSRGRGGADASRMDRSRSRSHSPVIQVSVNPPSQGRQRGRARASSNVVENQERMIEMLYNHGLRGDNVHRLDSRLGARVATTDQRLRTENKTVEPTMHLSLIHI